MNNINLAAKRLSLGIPGTQRWRLRVKIFQNECIGEYNLFDELHSFTKYPLQKVILFLYF